MRVLFGLAVVAATLYGAPQPTDARAIAANDAHTAYQASIAKSHRGGWSSLVLVHDLSLRGVGADLPL